MNFSPPGSSAHEILQVRILEWVAISFSKELPDRGIKPGSPALQADSSPSEPPGKPKHLELLFNFKEKAIIVSTSSQKILELNNYIVMGCL